MKNAPKFDERFKPGDTFHVTGYADELELLKDCHTEVSCDVKVLKQPTLTDDLVLIQIGNNPVFEEKNALINKKHLTNRIAA